MRIIQPQIISNLYGSWRQTCWDEARDKFISVSPKLGKIIDKISPGKDFVLYAAQYPFGATVVDNGGLYLPIGKNGELGLLHDNKTPDKIRQNLKRRELPVMMLLSKSAEIYKDMFGRLISRFLITPGGFFGLWGNLDPVDSDYVRWAWTLVSGARSLHLLPSVADGKSHTALKKHYAIRSDIPKNVQDLWRIFVEMANSKVFLHEEKAWDTEWLIFGDQWFDAAESDPAWSEFKIHMLEQGWKESDYWRNKGTFELTWEEFIHDSLGRNQKIEAYSTAVAKQLLLSGLGLVTTFTVADASDLCGPITSIQKAYLEVYGLKKLIPTVMQPHHFSLEDKYPVYYSMQYPNLLEVPKSPQKILSSIDVLPNVKSCLGNFFERVISANIAEGTPIDKFCRHAKFDYYHSNRTTWHEILLVDKILDYDERFLIYPPQCKNKGFAGSSMFFRGCISIRADD